MRQASEVQLIVGGFNSPEGPAFDRHGNLCFVNWLTSSIQCLTPDGQVGELFNSGGIPAGLAFHPDGSLWLADEGEQIHGIMRIAPDGAAGIVVNSYDGAPLNGANDLVFDRHGTLFFSDPWGSSAENPIGGFYRLPPGGPLERVDRGLAFPNGVAINAANTAVFLAETWTNRIHRYAIHPDGSLGPREHWATMEAPNGPDGMAFDANGDLYVAHWGGGRVDVFDPHGRIVDAIRLPGANATNCAFGGPDNRTLVMTEVETGAVYQARMHVAGQPLQDGRDYSDEKPSG